MSFDVIPLYPFEISTGGVVTFIGVLVATAVLIRTIRDEEISLRFLSDHLFFFVVFPLLLGRIGAFLSLWPSVKYRLSGDFGEMFFEVIRSFFLIGDGGIRADWALVGFFLVFFIIAFWRKEKFFAWLDAFILPGIVISLFVALGGYFSAWGYGRPAPDWLFFPLSIEYDLMNVRYSGKLYAVQLYMALSLGILFWVGWSLWQHKAWQRWQPGKFFLVMVFFLSLTTGCLDFFRGDVTSYLFGYRLPQVLSFTVALAALALLFFRREGRLIDRIKKGED